MIVVNKRYYDYDYDNNTIIMFDAEDVGLTLDFDLKESLKPTQNQSNTQNSQSNNINNGTSTSQLQSQSTETVPDDIIDPKQTATPTLGSGGNLDDIKEKEAISKEDDDEKEKEEINNKNMGNISWISSSSPKGLRRIPYALQVAHSYTINKLEVQLTTLVDKKTILKQKQEREKAKKLALAQQEAYYKQQQQQHAEYMASRHHQHGGHRQYPYHGAHPPPPHHPHVRPGYPHPHPPHPGYPHTHPRHYPHQRSAHHPPHPHAGYPPHPHAYQRKQEAPTSPSGRGYYGTSGHRQNTQYMTYNTNTNHAVQQQNKSK